MADQFSTCDVLVLGSGLAGLRAAIAAAEAAPSLRVILASPSSTPGGSSFANINARIGMIAPSTAHEREAFIARAMDLAGPGYINRHLVEILAEESEQRVRELLDLDAVADRDKSGRIMRHNSCFLREERLAVLFTNLSGLHMQLMAKASTLGVDIRTGLTAHHILTTPEGGAHGVLFSSATDANVAIRSRAVIAAMGGPAPLFARSITGPDNSGASYALLSQAGALLDNVGFIQFFWCTTHDRRFFRIHSLLDKGTKTSMRDGPPARLPDALREHTASRATHCPLSWGLADHALDAALLSRSDESGAVTVFRSGQPPVAIAPYAHSGNGGARIDANGATTVEGLYAAGESATGMHGADRIGGAMAAATQVFGHRAGTHAASFATGATAISARTFSELTKIHSQKTATSLGISPKGLAPIPEDAPRLILGSDFYTLDLIINKISTATKPHGRGPSGAAQFSALTVVRNLHTIA